MKAKFLIAFIVVINSIYSEAQPILKDIFGRNLAGQTITLVDWEGYMANPAIKLTLQPTTSPLTVTISANGPRLYFSTPSTAGATGPSKTISFSNSTAQDFYISIFPDRDSIAESYTLTVSSSEGIQNYSINVIDQDPATPIINYNIILDYSKDKPAYNFFSTLKHRSIVRQAADDWAFFIQNMNFDNVNAGTQSTFIWNDDFSGGVFTTNSTQYNGFLLYAYGFHSAVHRSGGEPSTSAFQKINNVSTNLRRSGGYEAEAHGNYNTLGWDTLISDATWYNATNFGNVKNDLYSIAMHEMGHAFCFNPGYPPFQTYKTQGFINDATVVAYQGATVPIDASDHLSNGQTNDALKLVDRISKKGAFGSEYANVVPYGRWLISKLNLLVLKAIGYNIKTTSAFIDVSIINQPLGNATQGQNYSAAVMATGGIPFYKFAMFSGALPAGLSINSFNGNISGIPTQSGNFNFTIRVTDYDNKFFDRTFSINVVYSPVLNLKIIIQGFYLGSNLMQAVVDPVAYPLTCDTIKVSLANSTVPYAIVQTVQNVINTNGNGVFSFNNLTPGNYYIVVRHKNSIETWSKQPVQFNSSTVSFDFSGP